MGSASFTINSSPLPGLPSMHWCSGVEGNRGHWSRKCRGTPAFCYPDIHNFNQLTNQGQRWVLNIKELRYICVHTFVNVIAALRASQQNLWWWNLLDLHRPTWQPLHAHPSTCNAHMQQGHWASACIYWTVWLWGTCVWWSPSYHFLTETFYLACSSMFCPLPLILSSWNKLPTTPINMANVKF